MNKFNLGLSILAIFVMAGCIGASNNYETEGIKNCVDNITCYQESLLKCEVAKMRTTQPMDQYQVSVYSEVKEGTAENCKIYFRITDIVLPANATAELKVGAMVMKNTEMICVGPVAEVQNFDPTNIEKCSGSLVDLIKTIQKATNN